MRVLGEERGTYVGAFLDQAAAYLDIRLCQCIVLERRRRRV